MSRVEPNRNVYVGHRYVPKIMGEWDQQNEYEGLSIVTYQGASYTSKKRVPVGIDILNEEFWVVTGNYNAQVDHYRDETLRISNKLDTKTDTTVFNDFKDMVNSHKVILKSSGGNDSDGFKLAFDQAKALNSVVYLPDEHYSIDSDLSSEVITSIEGNNSTINITGDVTLNYDTDIYIKDINFVSDYYYKSNTESVPTFITPLNDVKKVTLNNVTYETTTALNDGSERGKNFIRIKADDVNIKNFKSINNKIPLIIENTFNGTDSVNIEEVYFYNVQTGIYISAVADFVKNINIDNANLFNTQTQSANYSQRNGSDLVMIERGKNVTLTNLTSEYACERAVYVNVVENINIDNVTLNNSDGVKVVGFVDKSRNIYNYSKNVNIKNIYINGQLDGVGVTLYEVDGFLVDTINVNNGFVFGDQSLNTSSDVVVLLERSLKNGSIKNINGTNSRRGVIHFNALNTSNYDVMFKDIKISDIKFYNPANRSFTEDYYGIRTTLNGISELIFNNITIDNVKFYNRMFATTISKVDFIYRENAFLKGLINIDYCQGLYISNSFASGIRDIDGGLDIGVNTEYVELNLELNSLSPSYLPDIQAGALSNIKVKRHDSAKNSNITNIIKPITNAITGGNVLNNHNGNLTGTLTLTPNAEEYLPFNDFTLNSRLSLNGDSGIYADIILVDNALINVLENETVSVVNTVGKLSIYITETNRLILRNRTSENIVLNIDYKYTNKEV